MHSRGVLALLVAIYGAENRVFLCSELVRLLQCLGASVIVQQNRFYAQICPVGGGIQRARLLQEGNVPLDESAALKLPLGPSQAR